MPVPLECARAVSCVCAHHAELGEYACAGDGDCTFQAGFQDGVQRCNSERRCEELITKQGVWGRDGMCTWNSAFAA